MSLIIYVMFALGFYAGWWLKGHWDGDNGAKHWRLIKIIQWIYRYFTGGKR